MPKTTIQWVAHSGLILQQTRMDCSGPDEVHLRFRMPLGDETMDIRDLDHVDGSYTFNDNTFGYKQMFGPNGYSWILTHDLEQEDSQEPERNEETDERSKLRNMHESVAFIASCRMGNLLDGRPIHRPLRPTIRHTSQSRIRTIKHGIPQ